MQCGLDSEGVVVLVGEGQGQVQLSPGGDVQTRAEGMRIEGRGLARVMQFEGERGRRVVRGLGTSPGGVPRGSCGRNRGRPLPWPGLVGESVGLPEPGQAQGDAPADQPSCRRAPRGRTATGRPGGQWDATKNSR